MAYAMEEETTMMIPPQGMDEDMGEGIASLPEQGDSGIADLPQAAQQLAQLGRAQDTFLGHLAQDEIVIPLSLLQASPELEDVIRNAFEAEGMDYSQYVVGSDENSINPETGLPEFGFFEEVKKAGKKLERGVKSAGKKIEKGVKSVGKKVEKETRKKFKKIARELKRAAPVILPVALTYFAGPTAGLFKQMLLSGAGSGIGTLIAGGDTKSALKAAAISAALTGAIRGTQNYLKTGSALDSGSNQVLSETTKKTTTQQTFKEAAKDSIDQVAEDAATTATKNLAEAGTGNLNTYGVGTTQASQVAAPDAGKGFLNIDLATPTVPTQPPPPINVTASPPPPQPTGILDAAKQKTIDAYNATKDVMKKVGDYAFRGGRSEEQIMLDKARASVNVPEYIDGKAIDATTRAALQKEAVAQAGPGLLAKYGPTAALVYGAGKVFGGGGGEGDGDDSAMEEFNREQAEKEAIAAQIADLPVGNIDYITAPQTLAGAPNYQYLNPLYQGGYFLDNPMRTNPIMNNPTLTTGVAMARRGGEMAMTNLDTSKFPRRTGQISGPGTETSDSIPAMLSDGEFVMNARAVRGAGNGSREAGVRKMYDMMRNFESKVA